MVQTWMRACVVALTACTGVSNDPDGPAPPFEPELEATPSDERDTSEIFAEATAVSHAAAGTTSLTVTLHDTLTDAQIQLVGTERLVATVAGVDYVLAEDLVRTFGTVRPRYLATIPDGDPGSFALDFVRADGTTARSTVSVPAPYTLSGTVPSNVRIGTVLHVTLSPPGPTAGELNWACDDSTRALEALRDEGGVQADALGNASAFVYEAWQTWKEPEQTTDDCEGWFAILMERTGTWAEAFANEAAGPVGRQALVLGDVHLWPD